MSDELYREVLGCGAEILKSDGMQAEKGFLQHGNISCYEHSLSVAVMSVRIAERLKLRVNRKSLIRGALLHDYFLYDWHESDPSHRLHGFSHARTALENAERDFALNNIERDIIRRHMFPLNICPPRFRESHIVCLADKICAMRETASAILPVPGGVKN